MYDTCFLHCGHAKTGSTSVQNSLAKNRELVARLGGLQYPKALDRPGGNHVAFVGRPYVEKPGSMMTAPRIEGALRSFFESEPGSDENLAFSSESVSSLKPDELAALHKDLLIGCRQVKLVIYARHPLSYAPSFAQTQIKNGKRSLAECCEDPKFVQYRRVLPRYEKEFGRDNVIIRDFARSTLTGNDIVSDFLSISTGQSDIAAHPDFRQVVSNESLSITATVLADYMHRTWPGLGPGNRKVMTFLATFEGDRFCLPLAAREKVKTAMAPHLAYLAETYGIELRLDGADPYADVDYEAFLTDANRAQAAAVAAELGVS